MRATNMGAALLCAAVLLAGCSDRPEEQESGAREVVSVPDPERRILIATRDTEFKSSLVDAVVRGLKGEPWAISVTDITDPSATAPDGYDVIVIIDHMESEMITGAGFSAMARIPDKSKLVVVVTGRTPYVGKVDTAVDALTTPSPDSSVETVAAEVVKRIRARADGM